MSWKDYILTPDEIYPGDPVLSASYTLKEDSYDASVHVILEPNYYFSEFNTRIFPPFYYLNKEELRCHPVFESAVFGFTYETSSHSYKSGTGSVDSSTITWNSSFNLINTREFNFFYGGLSNYKSFIKNDGSGGAAFNAYDNESYYNIFFETHRPGVNYFRFVSNSVGSLSITLDSVIPSWLDPTESPPPPESGEYSVYLMETSDNGLLMHDPSVTASEATSKGWTVDSGKAYIIF